MEMQNVMKYSESSLEDTLQYSISLKSRIAPHSWLRCAQHCRLRLTFSAKMWWRNLEIRNGSLRSTCPRPTKLDTHVRSACVDCKWRLQVLELCCQALREHPALVSERRAGGLETEGMQRDSQGLDAVSQSLLLTAKRQFRNRRDLERSRPVSK